MNPQSDTEGKKRHKGGNEGRNTHSVSWESFLSTRPSEGINYPSGQKAQAGQGEETPQRGSC